MFFGLTNSPATFQAMMDHIFRDLIAEGHVSVYIDDIVIHTKTVEEHRIITKKVLNLLHENKLYVKPEKCEIEHAEIEYLGLIVSEGQIRMDPIKTKAMADWPKPNKKKDLQQFLGFCNFYRRFIKGYSGVAKPLTYLTRNINWKWDPIQQLTFDEL